ncbi:MAG: 4-hydroxy-tetrahydrodipicolinate synthase [Deltaproteobacteria bacterium]|nr:MAG: 4-hydroxy-tetrahydrodipicolinate synthase [Deltaproteobacteria bacterium]
MFEGVFTAIATPFTSDGQVDTSALTKMVEFQIEGGVDGFVPVGTTGESPTLRVDEHLEVIRTVVKAAQGKAKIIAGTGANSTDEALELTQKAIDMGVDGTLQVTPYYNKPSDEGLVAHFAAVADLGTPIVLYNVPGRAGREISLDAVRQLSSHPNVVAIKEAAPDSVSRVCMIRDFCDLDILSGDDPVTIPMMVSGAKGVISVASNVVPKLVSKMVHKALAGEWAEAAEMHQTNNRLFLGLLGMDVNPLPIKTALAMLGHCEEVFRLPMCRMSDAKRKEMKTLLGEYSLL